MVYTYICIIFGLPKIVYWPRKYLINESYKKNSSSQHLKCYENGSIGQKWNEHTCTCSLTGVMSALGFCNGLHI